MPHPFYPALAVLSFSAVLFLWARRVDARPADPLNPRLVPWRTIQIMAGVAAFLALLVLLQLFQNGAPRSRY
jgi:hypothetical protein